MMLPDSVIQGMGWTGSQPLDPALLGQLATGDSADGPTLHPAVLQGLGLAPPQPAPDAPQGPPPDAGATMTPAGFGAPQSAQGPDSGLPVPPPPGPSPVNIGGPGTSLPSAGPPPAAAPPPIGSPRDFVVPAPAPPPGARPGGPPAPAQPQRPLTVEQQMAQNQGQLATATQEEKQAVAASTQAQLGQAADALAAQKEFAAKEQALQQQAATQREEAAKEHATAHQVVMDRMKALDDYKIDQNQYWNSMGVGDHIGWYVGIALSQIGNALMGKGGENPVMQMLQDKMKQAIVMQQDKREQMKEGVGRAKDLMQEGDLYHAKRAADIAMAEAEATKMLKIQVDNATAKAADPTIRANGLAESAKLDRQLTIDTGTAIDKRAAYGIQKQQVGIAGGHLALAEKAFNLDVAWKSWQQNREQQQLDLQAAKESLAEKKAIGEKDLQLGVSAPVNDGKGGASAGMLTQKDGTVWHANRPEDASKVQEMVGDATSYNRLVSKMIQGIADHGGESDYIKSDDWQKMKVDLQHAEAMIHKAYDIPMGRGESTMAFIEKMTTGGVDPTSFIYNATKGLKEGAEDLQGMVNDRLKAKNYNGPPISFAPLDAPTAAASSDDQIMTRLRDNRGMGPAGAVAAAAMAASGDTAGALKLNGTQAKLDDITALQRRAEGNDPRAADLLGAISTDETIAAPVRAAAAKALDAATKDRLGARAAAAGEFPVLHPASPAGRAAEAESHIPGIVNRINVARPPVASAP